MEASSRAPQASTACGPGGRRVGRARRLRRRARRADHREAARPGRSASGRPRARARLWPWRPGAGGGPRVAPGGEVVLSDVVAEMTAIAARAGRAAGPRQRRHRVFDLEQIDQPDDSYDVVLCREGLMFAVDPGRAAREIRRVLRPGGRVALAVWGPRDRNPWLGTRARRGQRAAGRAVPAARYPRPVRARRRRQAGRPPRRRRARRRGRDRAVDAAEGPPPSTTGGHARPRSPDRWPRCSSRCPRTPRGSCAPAREEAAKPYETPGGPRVPRRHAGCLRAPPLALG